MSSLFFDEQAYKNILPQPKTHLFTKKMARMQALDRQMRKKWSKIKRDNQISNLSITQNESFSPSKIYIGKRQISSNIGPNRDHLKMNAIRSCLKRQRIISNHKRHEEIFYGRKDKNKTYQKHGHSLSNNNTSKEFVSISVDSDKRRVKTEAEANDNIQKNTFIYFQDPQKRATKQISPQKRINPVAKDINGTNQLPYMLSKRQKERSRRKDIITSQSQKELIELSQKSKHNMREWASHRKDLFKKLKGSRAYYIMKNPTRFSEAEDISCSGSPI